MLLLALPPAVPYTAQQSLGYPERSNVMALEMIRNKNGLLALIAREPVANGSYAEVVTARTTVRLTHPPGLIVNKWPALVPDLQSLSESLRRDIDTSRRARRRNLRREYGPSAGPELEQKLAEANRPPVCHAVAIGMPLVLKLPKGVNGSHDLGTIKQITIYNQGQKPVIVR